ncbi:uncharacterized protein LOC131821076 [Mustela lutreola]|uniref:uncharacterized protein LOC131821076 n=1 Tax=Mustela lutreola TaxID=9666 RepID=UPI002797845B|nr:uncharacterized protein LOC131821076 [Mustela lutreola]
MAAGVARPAAPPAPPHLRRARVAALSPALLSPPACGPGSRYTPARPPTARPPRAASARLTARPAARHPDTALPPPSTAVHRAPSTAWGPSDVGSAKKCLSRPRPLDSDSSSSPPTTSPVP